MASPSEQFSSFLPFKRQESLELEGSLDAPPPKFVDHLRLKEVTHGELEDSELGLNPGKLVKQFKKLTEDYNSIRYTRRRPIIRTLINDFEN